MTALVATAGALFTERWLTEVPRQPFAYLIFPFVTFAALRFGQVGATGVTFAASGVTFAVEC